MAEFIDYYEVLQVHPKADQEVVEKAYKALIFKHHPDRGGSEAAAKALTAAYYVLDDPERRREYDLLYYEQKSRESSTAATPQVVMEPVPYEVIDAILGATWLEGAAAAARTTARVVGASAVAGVVYAVEATSAVPGAIRESGERNRQEAERQRKAEVRRQASERAIARNKKLDAEAWSRVWRVAEDWTPHVSLAAIKYYRSLLDSPSYPCPNGEIDDNDLLWIALRHPDEEARSSVIRRLAERHRDQLILAHYPRGRSAWLDPWTDESDAAEVGWHSDARTAEFVDSVDVECRCSQLRSATLRRWLLPIGIVTAAVAAVSVLLVVHGT